MNEKFKQSVEKLKAQVDEIDASKTEVKKEMNQLINDLEHQIAHPEDSEHLDKLNKNVPGLVTKFEIEHPKLAEALNDIMVILSNMGI